MPQHLISPYGGTLRDLLAGEERAHELRECSRAWPSWDLSPEQLCDLELMLSGALSPLAGFMTHEEHDSVVDHSQLPDGTPWPVSVLLAIPAGLAGKLLGGGTLALRDAEGVMLAALTVRELWPGGGDLWYVGGPVEGVRLPAHYGFTSARLTPAEMRREMARLGWRRVVAFQVSRPIHRAEHDLALRAAEEAQAALLVQVSAGKGSSADVDHYSLVRCCIAAMRRFPRNTARLGLLPFAAGSRSPRETLLRAIVARNYGCTHLLLEPGDEAPEVPAALGVAIVAAPPQVFVESQDAWMEAASVPPGARSLSLDESELSERLAAGREVPAWFSFPEVVEELRRAHAPRHRQGFTVFFTGLSGSGKSTLAGVLIARFMEAGSRPVTLLDGDIVRKHLSSELGFSKEHRDINIRRIGFVASEITKNGGIAICAPIAPYDSVRKQVRSMVERVGGFVLVHVSTPLPVCESRDRKGLYAKARAGIIPQFTGVSDPYEAPLDAEVVLDTTDLTPEEAAQEIVLFLERRGYVAAEKTGA